MSSSVHIDNKNKAIVIVGEGQSEGLDDTILTAEAKYPINFKLSRKKFELINSKQKPEIKDYTSF